MIKKIILSVGIATIITAYTKNINAQVIGLSLPITGKYQTIAQEIKDGAVEAFQKQKQTNQELELITFDDQCDKKNAEITESELSKADIIIGPICFGVGFEITKIVNQSKNVPVITLNTRNNLLEYVRDYHSLPMYEMSPEPNAEANIIISEGLEYLKHKPFAIIDDGSVHAKNLADEIRLQAELKSQKPIAVESFRPLQETQTALIKRLQRSGVEALIIAGSPEDILVIVADMKKLNIDWPIIISEQAELIQYNEAAFRLPQNVAITKPQINEPSTNLNKNQTFYEGYALMEIAIQATKNKSQQFTQSFSTIVGEIKFINGRANHKPFKILKWNGKEFVK